MSWFLHIFSMSFDPRTAENRNSVEHELKTSRHIITVFIFPLSTAHPSFLPGTWQSVRAHFSLGTPTTQPLQERGDINSCTYHCRVTPLMGTCPYKYTLPTRMQIERAGGPSSINSQRRRRIRPNGFPDHRARRRIFVSRTSQWSRARVTRNDGKYRGDATRSTGTV